MEGRVVVRGEKGCIIRGEGMVGGIAMLRGEEERWERSGWWESVGSQWWRGILRNDGVACG